jgi:hypothetical protein
MNYKIRITPDNQAIVKRIADENGMNVKEYSFNNFFQFYTISNNLFGEIVDKSDYSELTTEQFIELFDKKETELDKWLKETKAKNLSLDELKKFIKNDNTCTTKQYSELITYTKKLGIDSISEILFNQWNNPTEESPIVETEWQPKRGDRVLVFDDWDEPKERIYLTYSKGERYPYRVVSVGDEDKFNKNELFESCAYQHMKPLPTEQPKETTSISLENWIRNKLQENEEMHDYSIATETVRCMLDHHKEIYVAKKEPDFKSQVIELIEREIKQNLNSINPFSKDKDFFKQAMSKIAIDNCYLNLINKIKQL